MKRLDFFLTSNKSVKQILIEVRDLLSDESRWAVGAPALDDRRLSVKPAGEKAKAWCLVGAIAKCSNDEGICPPALLRYLDHIVKEYTRGGCDTAEVFNDYIDHAGMMHMLNQAIEKFDEAAP